MVTWQLARAGLGKLAIADYDFVNAATTPRWILGVSAAGRMKVKAVAEHITQQHPYVEVDPIFFRVGNAQCDHVADDVLRRSLDGADIVVDCTVEKTVQHYLSTIAWERGIPYIWASATPGAWGGIVGRVRPKRSRGCWKCFRGHLADDAIREPQAEQGPDIQPDGCDVPTFRGAGFDLDEVALMCVRLAVSTLCDGAADGYGDLPWDVATVDLRQNGQPIPPKWTTYELQPHRDCDAHDQ
jgi:molybdopterin/thiamine biosynthesis adenylyltransferase